MTADEANRLAIMRFVGYQAGGQHFHTELATGQGLLVVDGDLDYRQRVGYAKVSGSGSSFTLQWNTTTLLAWPSLEPGASPPPELPAAVPTNRRLAATSSSIDATLTLLLQFGQDRPDNAQLIAQNGSRWLRSANLGSNQVDVLQGPRSTVKGTTRDSTLDYWVDSRGHLQRVDAALGGGAPTTILFAGAYRPFTVSPHLKAPTRDNPGTGS